VAKRGRRAIKALPAAGSVRRPTRRKTAADRAPSIADEAIADEAIAEAAIAEGAIAEASRIESSDLSLHDLFQQQVRSMLDRSDLDEEQRQSILIAASCPCCGAGGMSFAARIKRRS
jgi:hypothetical protein